jgi:N6-adenosine-specific RNA methylase IME4
MESNETSGRKPTSGPASATMSAPGPSPDHGSSDPTRLVEHPALVRLTKAEQALASAKDLSDLKKIIDIAEAARVYAKAARIGEQAARHAEEIKLQAQRKAGSFLAKLEKSKGGRPGNNSLQAATSYQSALKDTGIERTTAHRWQQVAAVPEKQFNTYLRTKENEGEEITTSGLLEQFKRQTKEAKREATRAENAELVAGGRAIAELGDNYPSIILDPPWDFGDEGDVDQFGRGRPTYLTMKVEEIAALPIGKLAADNAHMYLWITNRSLPKGFHLLELWGFRYVTALAWVKPTYGMGNYFRGQHEQVLFGVRGSLPLLRNDVGTVLKADRPGKHSSKPPEFYDLVESCSPGPWLELFARRQRLGWINWGAEADPRLG